MRRALLHVPCNLRWRTLCIRRAYSCHVHFTCRRSAVFSRTLRCRCYASIASVRSRAIPLICQCSSSDVLPLRCHSCSSSCVPHRSQLGRIRVGRHFGGKLVNFRQPKPWRGAPHPREWGSHVALDTHECSALCRPCSLFASFCARTLVHVASRLRDPLHDLARLLASVPTKRSYTVALVCPCSLPQVDSQLMFWVTFALFTAQRWWARLNEHSLGEDAWEEEHRTVYEDANFAQAKASGGAVVHTLHQRGWEAVIHTP